MDGEDPCWIIGQAVLTCIHAKGARKGLFLAALVRLRCFPLCCGRHVVLTVEYRLCGCVRQASASSRSGDIVTFAAARCSGRPAGCEFGKPALFIVNYGFVVGGETWRRSAVLAAAAHARLCETRRHRQRHAQRRGRRRGGTTRSGL